MSALIVVFISMFIGAVIGFGTGIYAFTEKERIRQRQEHQLEQKRRDAEARDAALKAMQAIVRASDRLEKHHCRDKEVGEVEPGAAAHVAVEPALDQKRDHEDRSRLRDQDDLSRAEFHEPKRNGGGAR